MDDKTPIINFTIDGKAIAVRKGATVYNAARQHGIELPIFCYQDRMPPFGACRVCLVEVEKMAKLQTSCTLEATEGMVVKTRSKTAVDGRNSILEFLLINHPLDCPICDRGGECPLQDNAMEYGPGISAFFEKKRQFSKAKPLGPVLMLDRERCIVCARCTRFGDLVAGDHALEFIDRGFKTEVGTPNGGTAESKFIGNTIMICPVGALTSNVYRFRARPWDNDPTDTTCTLCPVGCSMIWDARDGEIVRIRSRENRDVNDIWLCDKGWFGYEFISHPDRLREPMIRRNGKLVAASWNDALSLVAAKFKEAKPSGTLAAFGGNPLTVEENYLFQKLFRDGARVNNVDHRIGTPLLTIEEEGIPAGMQMSIGDCERLTDAIILGCDLTEEFPLIWLRLKHAINHGCNTTFMGNFAPETTAYFSKTILHKPGEELTTLKQHLPALTGKHTAIFIGTQWLNTPHRREILAALLEFQQAYPHITLNILEGSNNSIGARLAGMRPDLGPCGEKLLKPGLNAVEVLENAASSSWGYLHVAGADPASRFPDSLWRAARANIQFLVVQDLFLTKTARDADVVLPTLSYAEKEGGVVDIEGRIQKIRPGKDLPEGLWSDADIFLALALKLDLSLTIDRQFSDVSMTRPRALDIKALSPHHNGTVATFAPALFDQGVRMRHNTHLVQMAKEPRVRINPHDAERWNKKEDQTITLRSNEGSLSAKVKVDHTVAEGVVVVPLGFPEVPAHDLAKKLVNGLAVTIEG